MFQQWSSDFTQWGLDVLYAHLDPLNFYNSMQLVCRISELAKNKGCLEENSNIGWNTDTALPSYIAPLLGILLNVIEIEKYIHSWLFITWLNN